MKNLEKQLIEICVWFRSSTDQNTGKFTAPERCKKCNGYDTSCKAYIGKEELNHYNYLEKIEKEEN